jgi:hypothetical protein
MIAQCLGAMDASHDAVTLAVTGMIIVIELTDA